MARWTHLILPSVLFLSLTWVYAAPAKRDLYEMLGVARDASANELQKAYRMLFWRAHPDLGAGQEPVMTESLDVQFNEATDAYSVLSYEEKRRLTPSEQSRSARKSGTLFQEKPSWKTAVQWKAYAFATKPILKGGLGLDSATATFWTAAIGESSMRQMDDFIRCYETAVGFAKKPVQESGLGYVDPDLIKNWAYNKAMKIGRAALEKWIKKYDLAFALARKPVSEGGFGVDPLPAKIWSFDRANRMKLPELKDWILKYEVASRFANRSLDKYGLGIDDRQARFWATEVADDHARNHLSLSNLARWIETYERGMLTRLRGIAVPAQDDLEAAMQFAYNRANSRSKHPIFPAYLPKDESDFASASRKSVIDFSCFVQSVRTRLIEGVDWLFGPP